MLPGSGMVALMAKAPGVLPDGENQLAPSSSEIASSAVSPVEFRFQSIESLRSALIVIQYRVPPVSLGSNTECSNNGGLFAPKVPKVPGATVKLSIAVPG